MHGEYVENRNGTEKTLFSLECRVKNLNAFFSRLPLWIELKYYRGIIVFVCDQ